MAEEQVIEIMFLDRQLDGLYDAGGYRSYVKSFATPEATEASLSEFEDVFKEKISFDSSSMTHAFYKDALDGIMNAFALIVGQGIATGNPSHWLLLHDMLTCAARLSTCPGLVFDDDITVDDAIRLVALMTDVMARVSCRRTRHLAGLKTGTVAEIESRGASIRADIICGRVGAWLSFADDLGRECAWGAGLSWVELMNVYGEARQRTYINSLVSNFDLSIEQAIELMLTQASAIAASYDVLQQRSFARAFSDREFELPSAELIAKTLDKEIADRVADVVAAPVETGDMLRGYCGVFGVSAPMSIIFVESEMARILRTAYDEMIANAYGDTKTA